mmetsp:Transcript_32896/g.49648  ORF Transcript_32896/g.49648 Transcript_32896/m.49648 type:complete len:530 (-) Transcript_32896:332-1921(-)
MDLSGRGNPQKNFAVGNSRKREEMNDMSGVESTSQNFEDEDALNPRQHAFRNLPSTMSLVRSDKRLPSASKPMPTASKGMPMGSKPMTILPAARKALPRGSKDMPLLPTTSKHMPMAKKSVPTASKYAHSDIQETSSAMPLQYASLPEPERDISLDIPIEPLPKKKRIKTKLSNANENDTKFRPYQAEKWQERFDELISFQRKEGHCLVPHTFPENPALARWVKRQRYQYGLYQQNKPSSMTEDRIVILENIGFIWDSHEAAWQERLKELLEFKKVYGTCAVPSKYSPNPQLARWVKCQRRQYRLYWEGKPSNMNMDRETALKNAGFEWRLRRSKAPAAKDPDDPIRALASSMKPPPVASLDVQSSDGSVDMVMEENDVKKAQPQAIEITSGDNADAVMVIEQSARKEAPTHKMPNDVKSGDTGDSDGSVMNIDEHTREMPLSSDRDDVRKSVPTDSIRGGFRDEGGSTMVIDARKRSVATDKVESLLSDKDYGIYMEILSDLSSDEHEDDDDKHDQPSRQKPLAKRRS